MNIKILLIIAIVALATVACGGQEADPGLTREEMSEIVSNVESPPPGVTSSEVDEVVRSAVGSAMSELPEPGISEAQVEAIMQEAVAAMPAIPEIPAMPEPGLTKADVEELIQAMQSGGSAPSATPEIVPAVSGNSELVSAAFPSAGTPTS